MVEEICNLSTEEAQAGGSLSSEASLQKEATKKLVAVVVHTCNPRTLEAGHVEQEYPKFQ